MLLCIFHILKMLILLIQTFLDIELILNSEVNSGEEIVKVFAEFVQQNENELSTLKKEEPMLLHKFGNEVNEGILKQLKENCNFWKEVNQKQLN